MLYLTRKIGESVIINDDIEVTVVDIRGKSIKLGFTFPADASVLRREIHERIQAENRAAAASSEALAVSLGKACGAEPEIPEPEESELEDAARERPDSRGEDPEGGTAGTNTSQPPKTSHDSGGAPETEGRGARDEAPPLQRRPPAKQTAGKKG